MAKFYYVLGDNKSHLFIKDVANAKLELTNDLNSAMRFGSLTEIYHYSEKYLRSEVFTAALTIIRCPMKEYELEIFCLYKKPKDFPKEYVIRRWRNDKADPFPLFKSDSLKTVLEYVETNHPEKSWLARNPLDDKCILGTWI